jgi:hypothetical protein
MNEMKKKWSPILMLALLAGCQEPKHVTAEEFKREYALRNAQTVVSSEFLGEKDGKVFLRRKTLSLANKRKWNEDLWYTETNNLDAAFLELLKKDTPGQAAKAIGADAPPPQR